jgi:formamidopyrimidine-DNA glycosylase
MGADLWYYRKGAQRPAKHHLRIELENGNGLTCRFWWFGHVHLLTPQQLAKHRQTMRLGPSPMDVTPRQLVDVARQYPRGTAKSLIVDQEKLAGIGNAYAHDVLWKAGLHPQRKLATLSDEELTRYHGAIRYVMRRAIDKGGLEKDFHQRQGNLESVHELFLIGYKEGKPCPRCRTLIKKIRTGGTATFICPTCQRDRRSEQTRCAQPTHASKHNTRVKRSHVAKQGTKTRN